MDVPLIYNDIKGKNISKLLSKKETDQFLKAIKAVIKNHEPQKIRYQIKNQTFLAFLKPVGKNISAHEINITNVSEKLLTKIVKTWKGKK